MKYYMSKSYYVYIITNLISNKQYVGSKVCYKKDPEKDGYMGSSKYLNEDYKTYGIKNFSKNILEYYPDSLKMLEGESKNIIQYNTLYPFGYNKFLPNKRIGFHMIGSTHSEKTKERMRKSGKGKNKGRILSEEHKKHIAESIIGKNKGKTRTDETKKKIRNKLLGNKVSEKTKQKISLSKKGIHNSLEHNQNIKRAWEKRKRI